MGLGYAIFLTSWCPTLKILDRMVIGFFQSFAQIFPGTSYKISHHKILHKE